MVRSDGKYPYVNLNKAGVRMEKVESQSSRGFLLESDNTALGDKQIDIQYNLMLLQLKSLSNYFSD